MKRTADHHHAERCRELADILIPPLREVARRHGYALAVHGSLSYDIDLIACPWRDLAVDPETLAKAIQTAVHAIAGHTDEHDSKQPKQKPYGRLAWVFYVGGGPYVDLSVMPLEPPAAEKKPEGLDDGN